MLELVGKYLKVYPDSKFKENKSLSSKIWTAIANDFNNEVTPGSIRKKFSTVVQLYKVSWLIRFICKRLNEFLIQSGKSV